MIGKDVCMEPEYCKNKQRGNGKRFSYRPNIRRKLYVRRAEKTGV
jgi:hypothetical protein